MKISTLCAKARLLLLLLLPLGCEVNVEGSTPSVGGDAASAAPELDSGAPSAVDGALSVDASSVTPDALVALDASTETDALSAPDARVEADAFVEIDASVEADAFVEIDASVEADAFVEVDASVEPPSGPPQEIFGILNLDLIPGASIRTPFALEAYEEMLEFWVIREFRGFTELINAENGAVVMTVNDASFNEPEVGWKLDPLPPGDYELYLENFGNDRYGTLGLVKAIRSSVPYYNARGMSVVSVPIREGDFVDPGAGVPYPFTIRPDHTYALTGLRGHCAFLILAAEDLPRLEAGEPFPLLYSWGHEDGAGEAEPHPTELDLPPGDYVLVVANLAGDGEAHGFGVRLDEWSHQP